MADRYWVGGTDTWNTTAGTKWSTVSGGAGGASVPTAADNALFDAASGTGTVTLSGAPVCRAFVTTGFTGTINHGSATTLSVNASLSIDSATTYTRGSTTSSIISLNGTSGFFVNLPSKTVSGLIIACGAGSYTLLSDLIVSNQISHTSGTFNSNNFAITAASYASSTSGTKALNLGSSQITMTLSGIAWDFSGTHPTFDAGTSHIFFTGSSARLIAQNKTFYDVTFSGAGSTVYVSGGGTFHDLNRIGTAIKGDLFWFQNAGVTVTGTFKAHGNSAVNRLYVFTDTSGVQYTINAAAVDFQYVDFTDIAITGAAAPATGISLGNAQGNSGITFDTPTTCTWLNVAGSRVFSNAAQWSPRIPLPQDTAVISFNITTAVDQRISIDMPRVGSIDASGLTTSVAYRAGMNNTVADIMFFGDLDLSGNGLANQADVVAGNAHGPTLGNGFSWYLKGRGSHTINLGRVTIGGSATTSLYSAGGTYTLQSGFTLFRGFRIDQGTFNSNGFPVEVSTFQFSGSLVKSLIMGSSIWTLTSTTAGTNVWLGQTPANNTTINAGTSTIVIPTAPSGTRNFIGQNQTYYNLQVPSTGPGILAIQNSNTFNSIIMPGPGDVTLTFVGGTITTFTGPGFVGAGTPGNIYRIQSTLASPKAQFTKADGIVEIDYVALQNTIAQGGATWYAGDNSLDSGGNTGWLFESAPEPAPDLRAPLLVMVESVEGFVAVYEYAGTATADNFEGAMASPVSYDGKADQTNFVDTRVVELTGMNEATETDYEAQAVDNGV